MADALLIANPNSRQGDDAVLDRLIARFEAAGLGIIQHVPDGPDDVAEAVRSHRDDIQCVIVAGGDGTLNSAAGILRELDLPLGILPMGTANDLARTLAIPEDLERACDIIVANHHKRIDLGAVNGHCFFNVANIGLGPQITRELTPEAKKTLGVFSYLNAFFKAIKRNRSFKVEIDIDGRVVEKRSIQLAVGNGRFYGGGNVIDEQAAIDEGLLSLYCIEPLTLWQLVTLAPLLRHGKHEQIERVFNTSGRRIEIRTSRPKSIHADGEPLCHTPAVFEVLDKAIRVIVPADANAQEVT